MYFAHLNAQVYVYCNKITIMYSIIFKYICCCSVAQLCLTLCDPVDCSMTGFPVLHYLREVAETHAHWVSDAMQPSYPLSTPSPQTFLASGSFQVSWLLISGGQSIGAKLQLQSFQWIFKVDFRYDWLVGSPCSPRDSQESSLTPHFKRINSLVLSSLWSNSHIHTWLQEKIALTIQTFAGKVISLLFNVV